MTATAGLRARLAGTLILLAAGLGGCAWFQPPPAGPTAARGPGTDSLTAAPQRTSRPISMHPGRPDSAAALADSLVRADRAGAAAQAAADTGLAPADTSGPAPAPPDTSGTASAGADTAAAGGAPGPGRRGRLPVSRTEPPPPPQPRTWNITGDSLVAVEGSGGQVIDIPHPYITQKDLVIAAPHGTWLVDSQQVNLTGGVQFHDESTQGHSATATYYGNRDELLAQGEVRVESLADSLILESREARYARSTDVIHMTGNVRGRRGARRFTAEAADWARDRREVVLTGDVQVVDPGEESTVRGNRLVYDLDTDRARVEERPSLILSGGASGPIRIAGDRMWLTPEGNATVAGEVQVVRGGVTATADSGAFLSDDRVAWLFGDPRVEERDGTLTGDTLLLHFDEDRVLTHADVHGGAVVTYSPADSLREGETSIVRGDSLTMYFVNDTADRAVVFGRASSTYLPSPSDRAAGAGTNAAEGDSITIFLEEGEVDRVLITGQAKGVYTFGGTEADSASAEREIRRRTGLPGAPDTAAAAAPDTAAGGKRTPWWWGAAPGPPVGRQARARSGCSTRESRWSTT